MVARERNKNTSHEGAEKIKSVQSESSRVRLGADADLPLLEKLLYFVVYSSCFAVAVYKIYIFPLEKPNELYKEDFKDGWKFTGRKKDISDFEWTFWSGQFKNLVISSLLHSLGSRLISAYLPQYRMVYFAIFQILFLWFSLGWQPVLVFLGHNVLYYIASQLKSVLFSWFIGLILLLSFVSSESLVTKWQFYKFTRTANEGDFVLFTSLMCQLRGMSFCLDSCLASAKEKSNNTKDVQVSYGFLDLLGYNFYLPLFCNGPVVLYNEFYQQVKKPHKELSKDTVLVFVWDAFKTLWWFLVMELGYHYLYITSLARDPYIIENVSVVTSTGLLYTLVLLFSIKYVVFYRFAGMFARLDGVYPPEIPKCVLNIYLFTIMWKTFDKGLHNWLMKYIYIPLGGSKHGIFWQIVSSVSAFAYVYYWHGAYDYLLYWAIMQWCGVFFEAMTGKLLKTKIIQHLENDILSPAATRRLHAIFGVLTIIAAILSNVIFLVNYQSVVAYLTAVFVKGGVWTVMSFIGVAYCLVQVIMECNQTKQTSKSKKHL